AGGAAVQVTNEKMTRFLGALYELHIAAIKPSGARTDGALIASSLGSLGTRTDKQIGNVHDFVADVVLDTWFAFDKEGTRIDARLSWISPLRSTYIFTGRAGSPVMVFTPEELAWEVSAGKAELILEPVPLFDRAVSVT